MRARLVSVVGAAGLLMTACGVDALMTPLSDRAVASPEVRRSLAISPCPFGPGDGVRAGEMGAVIAEAGGVSGDFTDVDPETGGYVHSSIDVRISYPGIVRLSASSDAERIERLTVETPSGVVEVSNPFGPCRMTDVRAVFPDLLVGS